MCKVNKTNLTITDSHYTNTRAREQCKQKECHFTEGEDKSALCLIKHRTVTANGMEEELHEFLIPTLDGGERLMCII